MAEESEDGVAESIRHWRALATQQRERLSWDKTLLPAIAESRVTMYENTARSMELGVETGVAHCVCHLIPMTACAERARLTKARAR